MRNVLSAAAVGAVVLVAGCAAPGYQTSAPGAVGQSANVAQRTPAVAPATALEQRHLAGKPMVRGSGWLSPQAKACKNKVFVSTYRLSYVSIYCTRGRNQRPIGQITAGINGPEGENSDASGNLYVANANTVTEYAPGTIAPSFTYSAGIGAATGVAVDSKGNVYVGNVSPSGTVVVFPQKSNTPSMTITGMYYPIDVALDAHDDLYVTYDVSGFTNGAINKFPPGSSQGTNLGIVTGSAGGIAIDKSGNIVTADQKNQHVAVYPPGATTPSSIFGDSLDPVAVRLSHSESRVYVGDSIASAVYVYQYPSGKLIDTITDGVDQAVGVALSNPAPL